jgi:DNA-binding NarL/FixJ family response regulator
MPKNLVISSKTAGNHIEHIYTKIGTTNRAGASLLQCSTASCRRGLRLRRLMDL